jgi:uncharacterized protein (DUF4415 family)
MKGSKRRFGSDLARLDATTDEEIARQIAEDSDTSPELTEEQLGEAELFDGDRCVRRGGRPKGSGRKELITLRLDRDVLDHFRGAGPGWQTRLNEALRASVASADAARAIHAVLEASPQASDARMIGEVLAGLVRTESEVLRGPNKLTMRHREPAKKPRGRRRVSVETALPRR